MTFEGSKQYRTADSCGAAIIMMSYITMTSQSLQAAAGTMLISAPLNMELGLHCCHAEESLIFFCCRGVYEQLKAALALPCESKEAAGSSNEGQYLFSGGARHILPSFFNLLKHLQAQVPRLDPLLHITLSRSPLVR